MVGSGVGARANGVVAAVVAERTAVAGSLSSVPPLIAPTTTSAPTPPATHGHTFFGFFRITDDSPLSSAWLAAWFRSADLRDQTANVMHKSDMAPYTNLQDIGSLRVPVISEAATPLYQQELTALQDLFHALGAENAMLARTRDELLPLLMSGKLRVKDAEQIVEKIA